MKTLLLSLVAALALAPGLRADDVTVKITDVHLCCDSCVKGVNKAVEHVDGVKVECDKPGRVVTLTAPDAATAQKAADALVKAGYYGKCSDANIKMNAETGAKGAQVQKLSVEGVHLCCPKCVKAFNAAMKDVPGVTGNNAVKNAKVVVITGDFKDSDVMDALQKAGLTGKIVD
jgi:copper chaperone CopZ